MEPAKAERKWGKKTFSVSAFKTGTQKERAAMAANLVRKNPFKGKGIAEVRSMLGTPDGYFFSDRILAYQIEFFTEETGESWQIVLIPKTGTEIVDQVKIHKKCCYKSE